MSAPGAIALGALGAGLVAVAFGLARYAYGLFVPSIRGSLELSPGVMGVVGSMAFVSFALAILVAPYAARRLGARHAAMLASAFAVAGLGTIAGARGALALGSGVFACGIATGLTMPALSAAVQATVRPALQGRVNAVMNAGTSLGLVACAPAVLLAASAWRSTYLTFALCAALGLLAAWRWLPSASRFGGTGASGAAPPARQQRRSLIALGLFSFATGFVSAAWWIFGPDLVVDAGGLAGGLTALLWLAVGLAGLAGAWASDLADRLGAGTVHALALAVLAGATVLVTVEPTHAGVAVASAAVFGWAFMTLSGLYLVTGIRLLPGNAALGPVLPFLATTVGQAVGSTVAGRAIDASGHVQTFLVFAGLGLAGALCAPLYPRRGAAPAEEASAAG